DVDRVAALAKKWLLRCRTEHDYCHQPSPQGSTQIVCDELPLPDLRAVVSHCRGCEQYPRRVAWTPRLIHMSEGLAGKQCGQQPERQPEAVTGKLVAETSGPRRLIRVVDGLRLVEDPNSGDPYVALSYCWG